MRARHVHRILAPLCVAIVTFAGASAAQGLGLPHLDAPQAVPLDAALMGPGGQSAFVPLGASLSGNTKASTGSAALRGSVRDLSSGVSQPVPGATVQWWLDGTTDQGATTAGADGTYLFEGVPGATANGNVMATGTLDVSAQTSYSLAFTDATWPAAGESVFDFTRAGGSGHIYEGGPWTDWSRGSIWLYGEIEGDGSMSRTDILRPANVSWQGFGASFSAMPGRYDRGAVYWWANQGMELAHPIRVSSMHGSMIDVQFVDVDTGWLLAETDAGGYDVFRTADGGRTWEASGDFVGMQHEAFDFVDTSRGWVVGSRWYYDGEGDHFAGTIYATEDGGTTWLEQTSPVENLLSEVDFVDALHGCAVGDGGVILTTSDGGETWQERASGVTDDLNDVCFTDALHGWVCGYSLVLATTDGGVTWSPVTLSDDSSYAVQAIETVDGTHLVVAKGDGLYYSADAGATWYNAMGCSAWAVDLVDPSIGWALTDYGIMKTTSGGADWTLQLDPHVYYEHTLSELAALDATHAWVVGDRMLADTIDGLVWAEPSFNVDQTYAQRFTASSRLGVSGNPGSPVKLTLSRFPRNWVSLIRGEPDYPVSAVERSLGSYTSRGGATESKTVTLPRTAKPGYFYWFALQHKTGPLYLYAPFQVSLLKANDTSISAGGSVKLTGVVPTEGHWGSTAGKVKRIALFKSTRSAVKGFKFVKYVRANGCGAFNAGTQRPSRTTWYIVLYPGDKTYWQDVTSAVKVTVR